MTRDEFVYTFLEGAELSPFTKTIESLVGKLYDEREKSKGIRDKFEDTIEFMNKVARDSGWTMNCRSCGDSYQPDCELSEMFGAENYCGKSEWCCP